jgi:peptidoglycan/LPS O-acetylase OafA/YrhL
MSTTRTAPGPLSSRFPGVRKAAGDRFYRPELDVLRFAAFLCVFACHSIPEITLNQSSGFAQRFLMSIKDAGNFGVCIFFLLSSYLITELLRREQIKTGTVHLKSFYLRRILRIWPLYFAILIAYLILAKIHPSLSMERGRTVANLLLVGNWFIFFHPFITTPLRALWSISVEEQFYLTWPSIARFGGLRWVAILSGCLILISIVTIGIVTSRRVDLQVTVWVNSFVQFQFFALGALLAIYLSGGTIKLNKISRLAIFVVGITCWLITSGVFLIKRPGANPSLTSMISGYETAAFGSVLIFISVLGMRADILPRAFIYLGKISYGLYVFHETGFMVADNIEKVERRLFPFANAAHFRTSLFAINKSTALVATVALAMLSYRFLEAPFLNLKKKFTFVQSRGV